MRRPDKLRTSRSRLRHETSRGITSSIKRRRLLRMSSCGKPASTPSTLATSTRLHLCNSRSCQATDSGPPTMKLIGWAQRSAGCRGSRVCGLFFPLAESASPEDAKSGFNLTECGFIVGADVDEPVCEVLYRASVADAAVPYWRYCSGVRRWEKEHIKIKHTGDAGRLRLLTATQQRHAGSCWDW